MASIDPALSERAHGSFRTTGWSWTAVWPLGLVAAAGWIGVAALIELWPEIIPQPYGRELAGIALAIAAVLVVVAATGRLFGAVSDTVRYYGPWFIAAAALLAVWEVVTAKTGWLPVPFFSSPQSILEVFLDDWSRLGISIWYSVLLLVKGYLIGALAGVLTGVTIGWSQAASYWVHPVLRLIGPLPATAWLPLAFFIFPTSGSASVFLIALATAFPVTILTWSGIASVNRDYYDIARTLGAKPSFLILKVAVPAALPHVFVGLFMGLGTSFAVLVVAEMLGVKAGLGWYLQWAQGWAAYNNMYAALLVMALMCSSLITILFRLRDWTLSWQKGLVRW
ncbi:ABC transporter permease subunit [Mesorhizobium sp. LHD-90]|uniref:ABC transporter permease n=1 Tax=Mesorhizobium sp. LHD-90 TaxID=3071414 RepID=UPI0027E215A6|nr:ABC transporter permease subunit [Mesorhizobium sp. LHD-90]MDQ6433892.1 ABC transporter permease subunit [Mesorhizobium sp. LHD-90]